MDRVLSVYIGQKSLFELRDIEDLGYCQMPMKSKPVHPADGFKIVIFLLDEILKESVDKWSVATSAHNN